MGAIRNRVVEVREVHALVVDSHKTRIHHDHRLVFGFEAFKNPRFNVSLFVSLIVDITVSQASHVNTVYYIIRARFSPTGDGKQKFNCLWRDLGASRTKNPSIATDE